jgi:hypothetical protein
MHFAHAYYREELKEKGLNPDIIAQQNGKDATHIKPNTLTQTISFLVKVIVVMMMTAILV